MHPDFKSGRVSVKSTGDGESGIFSALVAVFDVQDSYGDVLRKGAFTNTLSRWAESGDQIPVLWNHDKDDVDAHIGVVTTAEETAEGLLVECQLDMDNPKAAKVFRLLKGRRVREFSFGFYILESADAMLDGVPVREVTEVDLIEVSPTLIGANPATRLVSTRSPEDAAQKISDAVARFETAAQALMEGIRALTEKLADDDPDDDPDDPGTDDPDAPKSATNDDDAAASSPAAAPEEPSEVKGAADPRTAAALLELLVATNTEMEL